MVVGLRFCLPYCSIDAQGVTCLVKAILPHELNGLFVKAGVINEGRGPAKLFQDLKSGLCPGQLPNSPDGGTQGVPLAESDIEKI